MIFQLLALAFQPRRQALTAGALLGLQNDLFSGLEHSSSLTGRTAPQAGPLSATLSNQAQSHPFSRPFHPSASISTWGAGPGSGRAVTSLLEHQGVSGTPAVAENGRASKA